MRYLPLSDDDRRAMCEAVGVADVDALFRDVPDKLLNPALAGLPEGEGELEIDRRFRDFARRNLPALEHPFFIGAGAYRHHIPASVDHLIQRGEFLTAYTPYQPEIAQGTLTYLFEFQSQVAALFGMEVANASMYDGASATAEAVLMAMRLKRGRAKAVVSGNLHPHYRAVVETMSRFRGEEVVSFAPDPEDPEADLKRLADAIDEHTACVVVQYPDVFGHVNDLGAVVARAREKGALVVTVTTEVVSLGLLKPPGSWDADIAVGEGQSLGVGLNFGGPHLGLFTTRQAFVRQMPGRLVGETVDEEGRRGFVLTLAAREQHIRREKATSNICTNSGLAALAFTIHMTLLGETGLKRLARLNHARAAALKAAVQRIPGVTVLNRRFFNELVLRLPVAAETVVDALAAEGILAGVPGGRLWPEHGPCRNLLLVAATETVREQDIAALTAGLARVLKGA